MNVFEEAKRAMSQGIEFLAGFDRQVALDAGFASHWVSEWNKAWETYFGRTRCKQQQRRAVDKAKGVPLNQLLLIENRIAHVEDELERWRLRHRLLGLRGNYESLKRQVRTFVPPKEKKPPKKGVRFHAPVNGMRSYTVTDDEREVTDVETHISRDLDPGRPEAEQKLERLRSVLRGDGGVPHAVPRPIVVVPVD